MSTPTRETRPTGGAVAGSEAQPRSSALPPQQRCSREGPCRGGLILRQWGRSVSVCPAGDRTASHLRKARAVQKQCEPHSGIAREPVGHQQPLPHWHEMP